MKFVVYLVGWLWVTTQKLVMVVIFNGPLPKYGFCIDFEMVH